MKKRVINAVKWWLSIAAFLYFMQWFDYVAFAPTAGFSNVTLSFNHSFNLLMPAAFALVFFFIGLPQKKGMDADGYASTERKVRRFLRVLGWIGGGLLVAYLAWGVCRIIWI
ncbi:hypothetical protein [Desmospora activa]|uniref:Uncharacterized protein n=1 Tax=Desmospora activa DSM 45169 TaxID=1121389 RepID=A0A2T4Z0P0_9BACL|nr:hypothetical protein [Desmospora activa]PTM53307.1 hypothetical protein C8J48_3631 [Desmospora activa DSM 45169]